ncbi:PGRS family protein [Sorangium sp. So ce341]|uniref:PGRS family protein n=1 Tax=Sorangium sp. So ce341 TaxID=3133302 RepID=UPI003F5F2206
MLGFISAAAATASGCNLGQGDYVTIPIDDEPSDDDCTPSTAEGKLASSCGLWVSRTGHDGNAGTSGAPLKTLSKAIELSWSKGKRIYVCAEEFDEAVLVPSGHRIFGGLDCRDDWRWIGDKKKTTLTAPEGETPLKFHGGSGASTVIVEDLHVIARSIPPTHTELAGRSSIAANTSGIPVDFTRCILEAGDGAPGKEGESFASDPAEAGQPGNFGNAACTSAAVLGGAPVFNTCGTPDDREDDSRSGSGGVGSVSSGSDGGHGDPRGAESDAENGGRGESSSRACTPGDAGADGEDGRPGAGAVGFGDVILDGYTGPLAGNGTPGKPGQGGGGGGGAKGGAGALMCPFENTAGGAAGGSGGAGGCGGLGGNGGGAGGASIAVFAGSATVFFNDVVLRTGRGGDGGDGGRGQEGGEGGQGGPGGILGEATGLNAACSGGPGGRGGRGGHGGGGLGGHSIAVAYAVRAPSLSNTTIELGEAGLGGRGGSARYNGQDGVAAEIYDIEQAFRQ